MECEIDHKKFKKYIKSSYMDNKKLLEIIDESDLQKLSDYDLSMLFNMISSEVIQRIYPYGRKMSANEIINTLLKSSWTDLYTKMSLLASYDKRKGAKIWNIKQQ